MFQCQRQDGLHNLRFGSKEIISEFSDLIEGSFSGMQGEESRLQGFRRRARREEIKRTRSRQHTLEVWKRMAEGKWGGIWKGRMKRRLFENEGNGGMFEGRWKGA